MKQKITSLMLAAVLLAAPAIPTNAHTPARKKTETPAVTHPWYGKRVAVLGDSISDPRHVGTTKCYWEYLAEWLSIQPTVYARSGNQWTDILKQAQKLHAEKGDSIDAILIFAGTNDYNASVPLGEWYTTSNETVQVKGGSMETRLKREMQTNNRTLRGRINVVMDYLKTHFPEKQIIVLTPLHRAQAQFSNENIQPSEAYPNQLGLYVDSYIKVIQETAGVWAVPVIDLHSVSGLYPMNDAHTRYFHDERTDRLHPNAEGHRRMAKALLYQLLSYPASFSE